jgi:AraC-like DNA-binding protein
MKPFKNERFLHICSQVSQELGEAKLEQLLHRIGVAPKQRTEADISVSQEAALLREATRATGDIAFAARAGTAFRQSHTLTAYIAKSSRNLRRAIQNSARFYALADPMTSFRIFSNGQADAIEIASRDGALLRHHRFQEFLAFVMLARLRALAGVEFFPQRLCFQHAVGNDSKAFDKIAGCPVEFGGEINGIFLNQTTLDLPLYNHDPELVEYLSELGTAQMAKIDSGESSFRVQVEKRLIEHLPGRILSADEVSDELGMSRRSLSRQLSAENTGFREVVDELRFDIAKTYLTDGLSISEIAFYLGYADHAAFSTAFRRWSGQSPSDFRKSGSGLTP